MLALSFVRRSMRAARVAAATLASVSVTCVAIAADGDPARGEALFDPCDACHEVGPHADNSVGPPLNAVVGRTAGTMPGFSYSRAMLEASADGLTWTSENIDGYIADPRGFLPGTRMAFGGITDAEARQHIVAYLESLGKAERQE